MSLSQICSLARVKMIVHFSLGANQEKEGKKTCSMLTFFDSKLVPNVTPTPANDNRHKSSFRTFVKTKIVFEYIRGSHTQACGRTVLMCSKAELARDSLSEKPHESLFYLYIYCEIPCESQPSVYCFNPTRVITGELVAWDWVNVRGL